MRASYFFTFSVVVLLVASVPAYGAEPWQSDKAYVGGDQVEHLGNLFEAKWWSQGFAPDTPVDEPWDTPWKLLGPVDGSDDTGSPSPEPTPPDDAGGDLATWSPATPYADGDVVTHNGTYYRAITSSLDFAPDTVNPWVEIPPPTDDTGGSTDGGSGGAPDSGASDIGQPNPWPVRFFAPFVDATLYPVLKLSEVASQTGLNRFALGFIVSNAGFCEPSWGGYYSLDTGPSSWDSAGEYTLYDELRALRESYGGDVVVSLGGAANTPLAAACASADALASQYRAIIDRLDVTHIDFDIEGFWVADQSSIQRRSQAIAQIQAEYRAQGRELQVWLTLPVLPTGLTMDGLRVVESTFTYEVALAGVNVMTMDYGDAVAPDPDGRMGEYGIQAATSVHAQLKQLYQDHGLAKTDAELWGMIGVTPMIGLNDVVTETFYLSDAQETLRFAQEKGLGAISMWSVNRDHPCPDQQWVDLTCSSSPDQSADYDFISVFKQYNPPN